MALSRLILKGTAQSLLLKRGCDLHVTIRFSINFTAEIDTGVNWGEGNVKAEE